MAVNDALLHGITGILQQATQALTQMQPGQDAAGRQAADSLQQAAVAASLVAVIAGGLASLNPQQQQQQRSQQPQQLQPQQLQPQQLQPQQQQQQQQPQQQQPSPLQQVLAQLPQLLPPQQPPPQQPQLSLMDRQQPLALMDQQPPEWPLPEAPPPSEALPPPVLEQADLGSGAPAPPPAPGTASLGGPPPGSWPAQDQAAHREPRFTEDMLTEPLPSSSQYVARHGLEEWVGEALDMMSYEQRVEVMGPPLNLEHTTNPNGVVLSRIKEVATVDHRIQMFVAINGLAEGVVDRLSTLTPEQQEAVMESSMKIQRAKNPSGVAMRRISDVLKFGRVSTAPPLQPMHEASPVGAGGGYGAPAPEPAPALQQQPHQYHHNHHYQQQHQLQPQLQLQQPHQHQQHQLQQHVGGLPLQSSAARRAVPSTALPSEDRSRSRPPHGASLMPNAEPDSLAPDVVEFVRDFESRGLYLEWWVGEVLTRMSLFQRQNIARDVASTQSVRNPSSFIMSRVRALADPRELVSIFIDLNGLDRGVADQLWELSPEQQSAVIAPGIYVQNVRNPSTAVRSRIQQVMAGNDAVGPSRRSTSGRMTSSFAEV
uniref:Uncharacterized protein n=1 Tax=Alexandrium monilatum TaxID=311494 RepID=A0A7S4SJ11_9DINO